MNLRLVMLFLFIFSICFMASCGGITYPEPFSSQNLTHQTERTPVDLVALVELFPELEGRVYDARSYMEKVEREKAQAMLEGKEAITEAYLQKGQAIDIEVVGEPGLTRTVTIGSDGYIDFPLIGEFYAAGKTRRQLKHELEEKFKRIIKNPQVIISPHIGIYEVRPTITMASAYIFGEVAYKGEIALSGDEKIVEVLNKARGFTPLSDIHQIRVIKKDKNSNESFIVFVNLEAFFKKGDLFQNIPIYQDDVILIPKVDTRGERFLREWELILKYMSNILTMKDFSEAF